MPHSNNYQVKYLKLYCIGLVTYIYFYSAITELVGRFVRILRQIRRSNWVILSLDYASLIRQIGII